MARRHLSGSWSAKYRRQRSLTIGLAAAIVLLYVSSVQLCAQNAAATLPHLDIYGFAMLDTGQTLVCRPIPQVPRPLLSEKALPVSGVVVFYDLNWSDKWMSTVGYSRVDIDNTHGQANSAFKSGQYALTNILYYPAKEVMLGPEVQWGYRDNKQGFHVADYKFQFSAKYNFNFKVGG